MKSRKGFTLLEIMIVLGILSALILVGLPKIQGQKNKIKTVVRQVATLSREVRNHARLKRMTYRIVFRLDDKPAYWLESAAGNVVVPSQATFEKMQRLDEKERPASPFQKAEKPLKGEKELPSGIKFKSIETPSQPEPVTKGIAYIYYTPEGLVEKAVIQINNEAGVTWSLILNPLTGQADIVEKPIELKDLKFE
ncbi:MAG: pilus assembly FimT family protein [Pseudobdellovibrionaceae bacterium]